METVAKKHSDGFKALEAAIVEQLTFLKKELSSNLDFRGGDILFRGSTIVDIKRAARETFTFNMAARDEKLKNHNLGLALVAETGDVKELLSLIEKLSREGGYRSGNPSPAIDEYFKKKIQPAWLDFAELIWEDLQKI